MSRNSAFLWLALSLPLHAELPAEAVKLRQSYLEAREKAVKPIDERYVIELKKLLDTHTRAGNLEAALAIRDEITRLEAPAATPSAAVVPPQDNQTSGSAKKLHRELSGSVWETNWYQMTFTLQPEGTIAFSSPRAGTGWRWKVSEEGVLLISQQGDPGFRDAKINDKKDRFVIPYGDTAAKTCLRKP